MTTKDDHGYREDWDMTTEEGSMCFASWIHTNLVGGEQKESDLTWLANYLRVNSSACRARAFLDQPEPEGLTDEELEATARAAEIQNMKEQGGLFASTPNGVSRQLQAQRLAGLRAVAARWGRPAVEPVPVSERPILKSSNFNDANGHCWCGTRASIDKTGDFPVEMLPSWELREPCAQDDCVLPHHALPAPTTITTETP